MIRLAALFVAAVWYAAHAKIVADMRHSGARAGLVLSAAATGIGATIMLAVAFGGFR